MLEAIENDQELHVTEPVIMEVTAGAADDLRERQLRRLLMRFPLLRFEAPTDFLGAARIYQAGRIAGCTPSSFIDCMVAAVALRTGAAVLSADADFDRIAKFTALQLAGS